MEELSSKKEVYINNISKIRGKMEDYKTKIRSAFDINIFEHTIVMQE